MVRWLTVSVALVAIGMAPVGCDDVRSGAPSDDEIVLYTSVDQEFAERVVARFTKRTGITVRCRFDTEATKTLGLVQRLIGEAANPRADVFWSSEVFQTVRLAEMGLLAAYESPDLKRWPAYLRDSQRRWHGFALRARVIAYNTTKVAPEDVPRGIEDLLGARWKGRMVMARPQFGTTSGHMAALWAHYGEQGAKDLLMGLKRNDVRLVSGNSTAVRAVAQGQADICLTDTDDVWVAQRNGWPVGMVYPRHGDAGTLLIPNTVAIVAGAPHAEVAGLLIDFLLSDEVERMLVESDSHNIPIRPALEAEFAQYAVADPMAVDYSQVAAVLPDAVRVAVDLLGD